MHDSRYLIFVHHKDEPTQVFYQFLENAIIYIHHCSLNFVRISCSQLESFAHEENLGHPPEFTLCMTE